MCHVLLGATPVLGMGVGGRAEGQGSPSCQQSLIILLPLCIHHIWLAEYGPLHVVSLSRW